MNVVLTVNGTQHELESAPTTLLVEVLREELMLTGTHVGCDTTSCGACTVIMDGKAIKSCTILAVQADEKSIETIEGLAEGGQLNLVQQAFADHHALQCGFCISGFVMAATAHLRAHPNTTESEVRKALAGNLCRCTGYQHIVDAVLGASGKLEQQ